MKKKRKIVKDFYKTPEGEVMWGLIRNWHFENRRWAVDGLNPKFLKTLSPEHLQYYDWFNREFYRNSFHKDKSKWLHKDRIKQGIWENFNAKTEDAYGIASIPTPTLPNGFMVYPDQAENPLAAKERYFNEDQIDNGTNTVEDAMIAMMDDKRRNLSAQPDEDEAETFTVGFTSWTGKEYIVRGETFPSGADYVVRNLQVVTKDGKKDWLDTKDAKTAVKLLQDERRSFDTTMKRRGRSSKKSTKW